MIQSYTQRAGFACDIRTGFHFAHICTRSISQTCNECSPNSPAKTQLFGKPASTWLRIRDHDSMYLASRV